MPFLHIQIGRELPKETVREIYDFCAQKISLIPQKNKDNLMVRIETDGDTYKYGKETPCAFVDVRLFGAAARGSSMARI